MASEKSGFRRSSGRSCYRIEVDIGFARPVPQLGECVDELRNAFAQGEAALV